MLFCDGCQVENVLALHYCAVGTAYHRGRREWDAATVESRLPCGISFN
jgi:hypothetical protein